MGVGDTNVAVAGMCLPSVFGGGVVGHWSVSDIKWRVETVF